MKLACLSMGQGSHPGLPGACWTVYRPSHRSLNPLHPNLPRKKKKTPNQMRSYPIKPTAHAPRTTEHLHGPGGREQHQHRRYHQGQPRTQRPSPSLPHLPDPCTCRPRPVLLSVVAIGSPLISSPRSLNAVVIMIVNKRLRKTHMYIRKQGLFRITNH